MAATFWALWKTRNKACFDNVLPADPCELIYVIYQYIDYWSNLQKSGTRKALARGIKAGEDGDPAGFHTIDSQPLCVGAAGRREENWNIV
jgi:hypothetical protein